MVSFRASMITITIPTVAASATASFVVPTAASVLGRDNRTAATTTVQAVGPRLFSYCSADLVAGDIYVQRYPSPDDCVRNCLPSTGCNAGTWTAFEGGTCYFKRVTKAEMTNLLLVPNDGAVSFLLKDDKTPSEIPYGRGDVDFPGNDFAHVPAGDYTTCFLFCATNARCSASTWSPYSGGTCYLKTKSSSAVPSLGTVSVIVGHERNAAACLDLM